MRRNLHKSWKGRRLRGHYAFLERKMDIEYETKEDRKRYRKEMS